MTFAAAMADALRLVDRSSQTSAVHDVVRNGLREVSPGVEVRTTDYFTHTFVPDLVLSWGKESGREERHVHLRFVVSDPAFVEEVDFLAESEPIFLGLVDTGPIADLTQPDGDTEARFGTLVAQPASLDRLQEGRERDQRTVTATREVVRGGHGPLGPQRASEVVDAFHDSLHAIEHLGEAEEAASTETIRALEVLGAVLRPQGLSRVERDLRSRWIRQGGDPFTFPGAKEWDPRMLTADELGEVLNALLDSGRHAA